MSRADTVKAILILESFAAEANRLAGVRRAQLGEEALQELNMQGTAPTWRLPDIAQITLPLSKQKIEVADVDQLIVWVQARHPDEVETVSSTRVRPEFLTALLGYLVAAGDAVIDPQTGEVVPGVIVRPGGIPGTLRITAERAVKDVAAATAAQMLGTAYAALLGRTEVEATPSHPATFATAGDPFALFPPAADPFTTHPPTAGDGETS